MVLGPSLAPAHQAARTSSVAFARAATSGFLCPNGMPVLIVSRDLKIHVGFDLTYESAHFLPSCVIGRVTAPLGFWPFSDANCASRLSARCREPIGG
jgi:hypothetical protein